MKDEIFMRALKKAASGKDLSRLESRSAFVEIMSGEVPQELLAAFLTALKMKGETVDEIVGAAQAMRSQATYINAGARSPVDTCGTGGDGLDTFNISTVSAFIAAGAGVCIAKHGNRAATSKCGSADVLAELGFNLDVEPVVMEHCLQSNSLAFLFAPKMHPAMRFAAPVRRALGYGTIFNLLGPLVNPAGASAQVTGVYDASKTELFALCLRELGCRRAFVVHGFDGMDEISACAPSRISELKNGVVKTSEFEPAVYLSSAADFGEMRGGDAKTNARIMSGILRGKIRGGALDVCLLNSAAAIIAGGVADDFRSALNVAKRSVESGAALAKLQTLIKFSRQ